MPATDSAYIIGVIREWEKDLLESDEDTRIRSAKTANDATKVLLDTPYGKWVDNNNAQSVYAALDNHLKELHQWIGEMVEDPKVLQFISTRFDGLNIATAIIESKEEQDEIGEMSDLGSISKDLLQSVLWNDLGWEDLPKTWEDFLRKQVSSRLNKTKLLNGVGKRTALVMKELSFTPLMKEIANLYRERMESDEKLRPYNKKDGLSYEREWDEKLLTIIKKYRFDPIGNDPILSFWYSKVLEVKVLKMMMSAKMTGEEAEEIGALQLPLYLSWS